MYAEAAVANSAQQREALILEHLPQVNWIASRIHEKLPASVQLDDLVSAGIVGLMAAVDNFDPSHNASLKTYAEYKIRGAILDSIRGLDGIPSHRRKHLKQVADAISAAEQRLKRSPSEDEIAAELGIPLAEYQQWMVDLRGVSLGSLDVIENGEEVGLIRFIADDEEQSPERLLQNSELERVIAEGIGKMPENERTVLSLYYKEELNLREIASIMGLHITRISQLRAQGILRLRGFIDHKWPSSKGIY
ncbi:MAG: FliA/WhiG family RNA polymerase sigma factor [Acidobacteriaceae bacterium]|nr:FliA/WhiG family RNA polymerase sigma factor [Acidobacteriaceae bacterium]